MKDINQEAGRLIGELKGRVQKTCERPGQTGTVVDGLLLWRHDANKRHDCFSDPVIGLVFQGHKRTVLADVEYKMKEGDYIAYGVNLPTISYITGVSAKKPYLAMLIPLDNNILSQLVGEVKPVTASNGKVYRGVAVAQATVEMLEACLRLTSLLDKPERIPVFAPMIIREIHYYLLTGPEGDGFRQLVTYKTPNNQIARAVGWLREHYREPIQIGDLAAQMNMSLSTFGRHFNKITGMSPLRYQKKLRLYEAQRLMLQEDKGAETVAYEVGYESPTQFNREYKRQFGEPPRRNIQKMIATRVTKIYETG